MQIVADASTRWSASCSSPIMLAHIYIGSLGMEGAYDAMGSGEVDLGWAKAHHDLWVEEEHAKNAGGPQVGARPMPAE